MRTLVLFYSRTGATAAAARALAANLDAEIARIECTKYDGALRYLLAGYDSVRGNLPRIGLPAFDATSYDVAVLGAPIWTSYPALPLRAFLAQKPELPSRLEVLFTYGGHSPPEKAIEHVRSMLTQPIEDSLVLRNHEVRQGRVSDAITKFADRIRANVHSAID